MSKKAWKTIMTMMTAAVLTLALTACGQSNNADLSDEELDSLMEQVADKEVILNFVDSLPEKALANAEVFTVERDGDAGTAYVYLNTGEYVKARGKAYYMSGSSGVAIIKFDYTEDGPKLSEVVWSADGSDYDAWLEENLPEDALSAVKEFGGNEALSADLDAKAADALGVPVETENLLSIDVEKGTYEITKVIESGEGDDYTFDTETIEEGNLNELAR